MTTAEMLLIEDNPDDAELTSYALRNSGMPTMWGLHASRKFLRV